MKIETVLKRINIMIIIIVTVLTAIVSFLPSEQIHRWVASPFYIGSWIVLFLTWMVFLIVRIHRENKLPSFAATHLTLLILGAVTTATFTSGKMTAVHLTEGDSLAVSGIAAKLGIESASSNFIRLDRFDKATISVSGDDSELSYSSCLTVSNALESYTTTVEVNRPARIDGIRFHQTGWSLGVIDCRFVFNEIEYDILNQRDVRVATPDGLIFTIYPTDALRYKNHENLTIRYYWTIGDYDGNVSNDGTFYSGDIPGYLYAEYNFDLVKEDYAFVSILQASVNPMLPWLAIVSGLFLLALAFDLWIRKKEAV